jgi:hypothetical protein
VHSQAELMYRSDVGSTTHRIFQCIESKARTFCFGLPITAGNTAFGKSSPAMPVLQRPDPLSMTTAGLDIAAMLGGMARGREGGRKIGADENQLVLAKTHVTLTRNVYFRLLVAIKTDARCQACYRQACYCQALPSPSIGRGCLRGARLNPTEEAHKAAL